MKRRLFNLATAVSFALLCAVPILQWNGRWRIGNRNVSWPTQRWAHVAASDWGISVTIIHDRLPSVTKPGSPAPRYPTLPYPIRFHWNALGFIVLDAVGAGASFFAVSVAYWNLLILFSILPAIWLWIRYRRKPLPGLCAVCGYDLRATPERCPECGTVPAVAETATTTGRDE